MSVRTRVVMTCPVCASTFERKPAAITQSNACSRACAAIVSGNLKPTPKGERRSVGSEFKPGITPANKLPVGSVSIRKRPSRSDVRAWVKVAEPNVWMERARVVYESAHGPIPRGKVVHHVDKNPLNDDPSNLVALTRAEHVAVHAASPST